VLVTVSLTSRAGQLHDEAYPHADSKRWLFWLNKLVDVVFAKDLVMRVRAPFAVGGCAPLRQHFLRDAYWR
jgi:hypothetical protein